MNVTLVAPVKTSPYTKGLIFRKQRSPHLWTEDLWKRMVIAALRTVDPIERRVAIAGCISFRLQKSDYQ